MVDACCLLACKGTKKVSHISLFFTSFNLNAVYSHCVSVRTNTNTQYEPSKRNSMQEPKGKGEQTFECKRDELSFSSFMLANKRERKIQVEKFCSVTNNMVIVSQ